jgi:hypothetical protein
LPPALAGRYTGGGRRYLIPERQSLSCVLLSGLWRIKGLKSDRECRRSLIAAQFVACTSLVLACACSKVSEQRSTRSAPAPSSPAEKRPPGIAWGPKLSNGLQAGLSLDNYEMGCREPLTVTVHIRNTSAKDLKFPASRSHYTPRTWFTPKQGKPFFIFDTNELITITQSMPWTLKAGKYARSSLTSKGRVVFADRTTEEVQFRLLPGDYTVTTGPRRGASAGSCRLKVKPLPVESIPTQTVLRKRTVRIGRTALLMTRIGKAAVGGQSPAAHIAAELLISPPGQRLLPAYPKLFLRSPSGADILVPMPSRIYLKPRRKEAAEKERSYWLVYRSDPKKPGKDTVAPRLKSDETYTPVIRFTHYDARKHSWVRGKPAQLRLVDTLPKLRK